MVRGGSELARTTLRRLETRRELAYPPDRLLRGLKSLIGQVQLLAIVRRKHEMPDSGGGDSLLAQLLDSKYVTDAFGHFCSLRQQEGTMAPVTRKGLPRGRLGLGDFVLVMRKDEVDPSGVQIQGLTQEIHRHRRALEVPARATTSPR